MRTTRNLAAAAISLSLVTGAATILDSQPVQAASQPKKPVGAYVVTAVRGGYTPVSKDPGTPSIRSGKLRLVAATTGGCQDIDPGTLTRDHWVATVERIWVRRATHPAAVLSLCVTQFSSAANAAINLRQNQTGRGIGIPRGDNSVFTVPGLPAALGTSLLQQSGFKVNQVKFSKGRYVVIESVHYVMPKKTTTYTSPMNDAAIATLTSVAKAQAKKLP